jgi:hypothetical protein
MKNLFRNGWPYILMGILSSEFRESLDWTRLDSYVIPGVLGFIFYAFFDFKNRISKGLWFWKIN